MMSKDDVKVGASITWVYDGTNGITNIRRGRVGVIKEILDLTSERWFKAIVDWDEHKTGIPFKDWNYKYEYVELVKKAPTGYVRGDQGMFGMNRPKTIWDLAAEQEGKSS